MPEMPDQKTPDARHERMIAALTEGATWEEAAERVGVNPRTLARWVAADPELAARAARARDTADDMVEAVVFANCCDPDPAHNTLRMFWLKSRRRGVYGERVENDHKGGISIRVSYADADDRAGPAEAPRRATKDT